MNRSPEIQPVLFVEGIRTPQQLFEAIRGGQAFEGTTATQWREVSVSFAEDSACPQDEPKRPAAIVADWSDRLSPSQLAMLLEANSGRLGRGLVIVHDFGISIELESFEIFSARK